MLRKKMLDLYLPEEIQAQMADGWHNFYSLVKIAFEDRGYLVTIKPDSERDRLNSVALNNYCMFHGKNPFHINALSAHQTYIGPFWKIENSLAPDKSQTGQKTFDPREVNATKAKWFFDYWQNVYLSKDPSEYTGSNFVLLALLGQLDTRRSWQSASSFDMVKLTLQMETKRRFIVKSDPKRPDDREEERLNDWVAQNPRMEMSEDSDQALLASCDYVVTENSSLAFKGLLYRKPAILFADADFHHICQKIDPAHQPKRTFTRVLKEMPEFEKYIYWFLQMNSINTSREWALDMIIDQCRKLGWVIDESNPAKA